MNPQLSWLLVFLFAIGVLIIITEWLHKRLNVKTEQSRKFLHVSGGLMCLLFPSIFTSHWWLLILAVIAFLILLITYKKSLLPSVHQTKRYSLGSVLFPLPVYICFLTAELLNENLYFYIPVSLLALADTAAETGGNRWGHRGIKFFNGQKTLAGSLSFFTIATIVCFTWLYIISLYPAREAIWISAGIALSAAITETVTLHGWDNLSVPAVSIILLWLYIN